MRHGCRDVPRLSFSGSGNTAQIRHELLIEQSPYRTDEVTGYRGEEIATDQYRSSLALTHEQAHVVDAQAAGGRTP